MEFVTEIVAWLGFPFGAFVLGMSLAVLTYYAKGHRYIVHISLMASSYSLMAILLIASVNYRIFYDGTSRFVGSVLLLVAYILGTWGLLRMFRQKRDEIHRTRE